MSGFADVPSDPAVVRRDVPAGRGERLASYAERKAEPKSDPAPEPVPVTGPSFYKEPEPPKVSREVESAARTIGIQVRQRQVLPKLDYFVHGIPRADTEAWIAHAVSMQWVLEDGDLLRPGPVSPYPDEPTAEGKSDHWSRRFVPISRLTNLVK